MQHLWQRREVRGRRFNRTWLFRGGRWGDNYKESDKKRRKKKSEIIKKGRLGGN